MAEPAVIGVIVPLLGGNFAAALLEGVTAEAQRRGAQVLAFEGPPAGIGGSHLARERIAGWIVFLDATGIESLLDSGAPAVVVSAPGSAGRYPTVLPDNHGGIQAVMQHLFEHGHERIGFIGALEYSDIQERYASYRAALERRGLAFDPQLVADSGGYLQEHGRAAVRGLLARGARFSALVTAGDFNAIGAVEALHDAGLRVPDDVAVTGFDDVSTAQFAEPPLTTVRQRPAALGELAVGSLLEQIAGGAPARGALLAPTALVRRRSCGCRLRQGLPTPDLAALAGPDWQAHLALQLALILRHPLPLDPGQTPAQVWPGALWLTEQLAGALQGLAAPDVAALEQPWHEVVALTDHVDTLYAMIKLLETAAQQQLGPAPEQHPAYDAVNTLVDRARLAMMRARLDGAMMVTDMLERMTVTNHAIDEVLLNNPDESSSDFGWLARTPAEWACLGLWGDAPGGGQTLTVAGLYQRQGQSGVQIGSRCPPEAFPPAALLAASAAARQPSNVVMLPVSTAARAWGILALCLPSAGQLVSDLHGLRRLAPRLAAKLERDALLRSLRAQQETLAAAYDRERALASTIRELGCPVIPLLNQVLLVPLVGAIDSGRAEQIIERVLEGVRMHQAQVILLDVTAVPIVDTQVANSLLQTAQAVKMLGARTIMVGMRPELAQSIVGLGLDLRQIATFPSLAAALTALSSGRAARRLLASG